MSEAIAVKWVVITGAPSSGKTSLIDALRQRGYAVLHEAARKYIEAEVGSGRSILELRGDEGAFQNAVLNAKLDAEGALDPQVLVFLDRAIPDTCAYCKLANLDVEPLDAVIQTYRYQKVFVLDPLKFEKDGVRTENSEARAFLDQEFERDYRRLGYDVMRVPVMPIEDRIDFILGRVQA